ncbi:hypothetical protein DICVIV_11955 [Dictyocaulus viviparus]|uniref:glucuronosyltransferase n=1 Tax=Dictyocaulus viviparus TaxID=29172 RepID=A0A0D8XBS2_DICVI|nr:hypothetical protein DICVIV_11955 [Dictyocaulus viviparus]
MNYLLLNSDEFLDYARPATNRVVYIGGIALPKLSPLSEELQKIMDQNDKEGVVYISFGSVVPTKHMPPHIRDAIVTTARKHPMYSFIWKIDDDDVVENVANLYTFTWVPQRSILAHRNLRCFVSHAGLNSVLELAISGKPSILIPIFADQFRNARMTEAKNTTILIAKEELNSDTLSLALYRVLSDDSFAYRAERLASLMKNKPFSIRERLLSTVEFSIQHGKIDNLDTRGRKLNAIQYYSIDSALFLSAVVFLTILGAVKLFMSSFYTIFTMKTKKE